MKTVRKLIEVALPLDDINRAAAREKSIRHGHPSTLHLWWARRPLAAARAVIFAQIVDDPSARPELFPTKEEQDAERERLFGILRQLVLWKNTTNETVLEAARAEIRECWRRTCADNADHPRARELFDPERLPAFHDPFAGGGALPLEAQRLGLEAHASDLNPVAVLINKAMIEIPPKFAGRPPVNPEARSEAAIIGRAWPGAQGLAEDIRYYGRWMRDEAHKRIGHLYPPVEITPELVRDRPDLRKYKGRKLPVIAWLWARTVRSPNPAFSDVEVPLASTFVLSTKKGKEAWVEPVVEGRGYRFTAKVGNPPPDAKRGTKSGGSGSPFLCLMSGTPMPFEYLRTEAKAGRMGDRLMAVVCEGSRGRVYVSPTDPMEAVARDLEPCGVPDTALPAKALGFRIQEYGMARWCDLFTPRQLVSLTTFSDLVGEAMGRVRMDAAVAGLRDDGRPLREGGTGASAYAEAVGLYLALAVDRLAMTGNCLVRWNRVGQKAQHCFARQALPMVWDFAEPNFFAAATGSAEAALECVADPLDALPPATDGSASAASQRDARSASGPLQRLLSTDPPYYDNIGYADLSDFFYVWLRPSVRPIFPELFSTLAVPKAEELVATAYRHGSKKAAESFFLDGMSQAMRRIAGRAHPVFPVTIYYSFKQSEMKADGGVTRTGWETFLDAAINSGLSITATWPMRTELRNRIGMGANLLASSIVLACRRRPGNAPVATRRDFLAALRAELPTALRLLQSGNIAPVDLAQTAIGPGMAVFTRYARVLHASGERLTVAEALALINEALDETLAEQEGDFDTDTRWALAWFAQHGFEDGRFGDADILSKAKNNSVEGLVDAGILQSREGRVRLVRPEALPKDAVPANDEPPTTWEIVHRLIRELEEGGEAAAGDLLRRIGGEAATARELAYSLFTLSERKRLASEARSYNALVISWPEIARLADDRKVAHGKLPMTHSG